MYRWFSIVLVLLSGCADYIDVDPETNWSADDSAVDYEGEPTLELGFYQEQLYTLLEDGSGCPVVYGLQGGTWTMPALRTRGITPMAWVTCVMVLESGEEVARTEVRSQFFRGTDDFFEIQSFPIPVFRTTGDDSASVSDLYGIIADLRCSAVGDNGETASYNVLVEIVD